MANPCRIGVFGGTFDPIHNGHLAIARAARAQAALDRVLFVIASNPPHKPDATITSADLRAAMTEAAIANEPAFEISRVELDRPGLSFTVDTLTRLHEGMPDAELFFIVGYDSALDLPRWRRPEEIMRLARLLVAPRPQNRRPLPALLQGRCDLLSMEEWPIASSDIRKGLQMGEDMGALLPEPVLRIIADKELYHADSSGA